MPRNRRPHGTHVGTRSPRATYDVRSRARTSTSSATVPMNLLTTSRIRISLHHLVSHLPPWDIILLNSTFLTFDLVLEQKCIIRLLLCIIPSYRQIAFTAIVTTTQSMYLSLQSQCYRSQSKLEHPSKTGCSRKSCSLLACNPVLLPAFRLIIL